MQANELVTQADALKAEIDKLRPLKPEVERRIMQKFRLDWNYHSNAIEGNSLTLGETRAFLLEGLTANGKPMKDHLDIKGHDDLITFLELFIQRKETLTEAAIREMHKILLKEPYEVDAITPDSRIVKKKVQLGAYKTEPNCARMQSGEIHQYVLPEDVPAKMAELVEWHRQQDARTDSHPVFHAAIFHHRFVSIHPFDDGNGRMARILMNLILMRSGFPPAVIKLQDRNPYIAALRQADAGETEGIMSFVAQNLVDTETLYLRGAQGKSIEDLDDIDKEIALFKQQLTHVEVTLPLTHQLQRESIEKSVMPLLDAVEIKLSQFDDLFFSNLSAVTISSAQQFIPNQRRNPNGTVGLFAPNTTSTDKRGTAGKQLKGLFDQQQNLLNLVKVIFNWRRFTKAYLDTFDLNLSLEFKFEELQLVITSSEQKTQLVSKRYPHQLTKEEIHTVASTLAKTSLEVIRQQTGKKPAA
jgi:Fic family protein